MVEEHDGGRPLNRAAKLLFALATVVFAVLFVAYIFFLWALGHLAQSNSEGAL